MHISFILNPEEAELFADIESIDRETPRDMFTRYLVTRTAELGGPTAKRRADLDTLTQGMNSYDLSLLLSSATLRRKRRGDRQTDKDFRNWCLSVIGATQLTYDNALNYLYVHKVTDRHPSQGIKPG